MSPRRRSLFFYIDFRYHIAPAIFPMLLRFPLYKRVFYLSAVPLGHVSFPQVHAPPQRQQLLTFIALFIPQQMRVLQRWRQQVLNASAAKCTCHRGAARFLFMGTFGVGACPASGLKFALVVQAQYKRSTKKCPWEPLGRLLA